MRTEDLRVALFSGNYNYVRDGANQALNRLVDYLLRQGVAVRIYSPTTKTPDFEPVGDLVSTPSFPFPGRQEYLVPTGMSRRVRKDLDAFKPNVIHVSSPEILGHAALAYGRKHNLPVAASMHTRFDTYFRYYGLAFLEPLVTVIMRRFYRQCDVVVAPSESMAQVLRQERMGYDIGIWTRGIDRTIFRRSTRDMDWRRSLGFADDDVVIGYIGRLVMEKGLDVFSDTIDRLSKAGIRHKVLIIGEGPARAWFTARLPDAVFTGFLMNAELGRAVASMDVLFNPSVTEAFGNVTNEAMASGVPVVAALATGSSSLVHDGETGRLITPGAISDFAEALADYCTYPTLRAKHGAAGEMATAKYDWDSVNQAMIDTYLRIVDNHARGLSPPRPGPWGFE